MAFLSAFYPQPVVAGTTAGTYAAGDDARLSDSRTPTVHAASHAAGESDELYNQSLNTTDEVRFGNLTVGNGTQLAVGSNYGQFTSASGNAGFSINRGTQNGYASIDLLQEAELLTGWSVQMQPSDNDLHFANRVEEINQLTLPASGTTAIKTEGNIEIADTDNATTGTLVAYTNLTANRTYDLPDASGTLALTSGATDIEITDATKGLILRSANGTRYRLTIDNDGIPTTTAL